MIKIPFKKAKYEHHRQKDPEDFKKSSLRTVPFHHADYRGEKFKKYHKKSSGAKAIVGKDKKTGKWKTQSILIPKNNPKKKRKPFKRVTNYQYLLGDFDKDKIRNIDDRYPFRKSTETVEETRLSTPVRKSYKLHTSKKKSTKIIVSDFRKMVNRTRTIPSKKTLEIKTPYRTKTPISIINKAYNKGIVKVRDFIGVAYVGKDYDDLKSMRNHVKKNYKIESINDYYKDLRRDGYKGIHIKAIDPKTSELFEIQLKTKRIKRLADINHTLYKEGKQNPKEFKKLINISEKADNGDKQAQEYIDNLSRKQIEKFMSK